MRKDLAVTGIVGKPRVGYPVDDLIAAIEGFLHWDKACNAVVIGSGNLGSALMGYKELKDHGLTLVAAFDAVRERTGSRPNGITVYPMDSLKSVISTKNARLAILTVPSAAAQDRLRPAC